MRIFGREPALWIGFIGSALMVLTALNVEGFTDEQVALIVGGLGAVAGAVQAIFTRPIAPGVFTAAVTALAALAVGYGFEVAPALVGAVNMAVLAFLSLITRGEVSPAAVATRPLRGHLRVD